MDVAEQVCEGVSRRVIRTFQRQKGELLSGEDSGLSSVWEEICVQVQGEEFGCWDLYTDLIAQLIETEVEKLKPYEQDAVWLQTPEGEAWSLDDEQEREKDPSILEDVVAYISGGYFFPRASDWGNRRIRDYLDRDCLPDTLFLNGQAQ